jgi:hypothetical protein
MSATLSRIIVTLALILFAPIRAEAAPDEFAGIRCGADISSALKGRPTSNGPVAAMEARHKDISLTNLGGTEISDRLFSTSWKICGSEFMTIEDSSRVRDVLRVPPHSKAAPLSIGECTIDRKTVPNVVAILDGTPSAGRLSAKLAWKIDAHLLRFVPLPTAGLSCPRDGIITTDGGT